MGVEVTQGEWNEIILCFPSSKGLEGLWLLLFFLAKKKKLYYRINPSVSYDV